MEILWTPSPSYFKCQTQAQCLAQELLINVILQLSPSTPFSTNYLPLPLEKREGKNVKKRKTGGTSNFLMFSFIYKKSKVNLREC